MVVDQTVCSGIVMQEKRGKVSWQLYYRRHCGLIQELRHGIGTWLWVRCFYREYDDREFSASFPRGPTVLNVSSPMCSKSSLATAFRNRFIAILLLSLAATEISNILLDLWEFFSWKHHPFYPWNDLLHHKEAQESASNTRLLRRLRGRHRVV